ncbi:unnamed protein product, partial [Rotaria sp. Silwood2]
ILVFKFIAKIGDNDENATSNTQISTDEDKSSLSSEVEQNDEISSIDVQTDPTLQEIRLLVKRIRGLVSLVCKSSNLHKYVQQQKKEKKLPGGVLRNVLSKIYEACQWLSGKHYQTLSIVYVIKRGLYHVITQPSSSPQAKIENIIKKYLLIAVKYHFDEKLSVEQKETILES